jgi:hypothetical protein
MFHCFQFNRDEFLQHYHKRSNVEPTFSMIKAKFRDTSGARRMLLWSMKFCAKFCVTTFAA